MATALASLRAATRDACTRLDATPLLRGLRSGTVSRVGYLGYLRLLAVIHASLDRMLRRAAPQVPAVAAVWAESSRPLSLLLEDLEHFRLRLVPDVVAAMDIAFQASQKLTAAAADSPHALLGHLFVLETLLAHGSVPQEALGEWGAGPTGGSSYLREGSKAAARQADRFAAALDASLGESSARDAATAAALQLLAFLEAASGLLEPAPSAALGVHVAALNPEGGAHAVIQDRRELRAVLDASDRCLAQHPYFVSRYGSRGRRFTDSDGAWLAHLVDQEGAARRQPVDWLGRLLAARGMPTQLLQIHLDILAEELARALPGSEVRYQPLRDEAARLGDRIRSCIPRELARALAAAFADEAIGEPGDPQACELGSILVAAVADEVAGVTRAVPSVRAWVADAERFSPRWITAVDRLLLATRANARKAT